MIDQADVEAVVLVVFLFLLQQQFLWSLSWTFAVKPFIGHTLSVHDTYVCVSGRYVSVVFMLCLEVLLSEEENRDLHRRCVEQYDHLCDEFERYKLRAQSVLKNKSSSTPKVYLDLTIDLCLVCFDGASSHHYKYLYFAEECSVVLQTKTLW